MKKKQLRELINHLKKLKKEDDKIDKNTQSLSDLLFDGQHKPFFSPSRLSTAIDTISIIDKKLSEELEYMFYDIDDWDKDRVTVTLADGTEIKVKDFEKWIINEFC